MEIAIFTFNGFQENTYILYDNTKECVIIDPGCNNKEEENTLSQFIESKKLDPVLLLNTHCHIDHVLGNEYVNKKYGLLPRYHKGEQVVMDSCVQVANMYGIAYTKSPDAIKNINEGELIHFGDTTLKTLFTPGHSPASISFYNKNAKMLIAGDVLFAGSIGRTDLPGGDFDTLIKSIKTELLVLDDDVRVFAGHGPDTTIGVERVSNPFLV